MTARRNSSAIGLALAALMPLTGCQTSISNGIEIVNSHVAAAPQAAATRAAFARPAAGIASIKPADDGMAHTTVKLVMLDDAPARHFGLLNVVGWTAATGGALFTLFSTSARTAGNAAQAIVAPGGFTGAPLTTAAISIPVMRPAIDYVGQIFLTDAAAAGAGKLWGSKSSSALTLKSGANNLVFTVNQNTAELSAAAVSSTANNQVTGNNAVYTDVVNFNTGIMNGQDGVTAVNVYLWGTCYGATAQAARVLIGQVTTSASFSTFPWTTNSVPGVPIAPNTVVAPVITLATLTGSLPAGSSAPVAGNIDFEAVDTYNNVVSKNTLAMGMFGLPTLTLTVN